VPDFRLFEKLWLALLSSWVWRPRFCWHRCPVVFEISEEIEQFHPTTSRHGQKQKIISMQKNLAESLR
jgi:heterodisulfide reductase subunit C